MRKILHNEVKEEKKENTKKCLSRIEMKGKKTIYTQRIHQTHTRSHKHTSTDILMYNVISNGN